MKEEKERLKDLIYKILYDKSRVDGIRLINEDEWPIDELVKVVLEEKDELLHRVLPLRWTSDLGTKKFLEALEEEVCTKHL